MTPEVENQMLLAIAQLRAEAVARGAMFDQILTEIASAKPDPVRWLNEQKGAVIAALTNARATIKGNSSMQLIIGNSIPIVERAYDDIVKGVGIELKKP